MSLLITDAGIAASIQASNLGVSYKITHIAMGASGYTPTHNQTSLRDEIVRRPITQGSIPALGQLHFEVLFGGDIEYEAREIGYFLEDGTLFAVDSREGDIISIKRSDTVITEVFNLTLSGSEINTITVEILGAANATERVAGIAKIATREQMGGDNDEAIITPKKLKDKTATDEDIDAGSSKAKIIQLPQFWRGIQRLKLTQQFQEYNKNRKYLAGEICYTKNSQTGELSYWQWYSNVESLAGKDPLDLNNRFVNWSDITKPPYWIPYVAREIGSTVWFGGIVIPETMLIENNQDVPKAVYWRLALARPELVVGDVIQLREAQGRYLRAANGSTYLAGETHEDAIRDITGVINGRLNGAGGAFRNIGGFASNMAVSQGNSERYEFKASRVVPTANQNQPVTMIEWKGVAI